MILIIIALFFGAYVLHKNADKVKENAKNFKDKHFPVKPPAAEEPAPRELSPQQDYDPDSLAGPGLIAADRG